VLLTSLDFKLGLRMLVKHPGITFIGVIALAVAIGGGAAYLEFINDIFRPTLHGDAARIVGVRNLDTATGEVEHRAMRDLAIWQRESRTLDRLGAFVPVERNLITSDGRVEPVRAVEISTAAFQIMPATPLLGRPLIADDEQASAPSVILLGHDLWQSRFNSDPAVVDSALQFGAQRYTVVGVMPPGYRFPVNHSLWIPLRIKTLDFEPRSGPAIRIFGRLAPGATIATAEAELNAISQRTATSTSERRDQVRPQVKPYVDSLLSANGGQTEILLLYSFNLFFVALLGVCGANVATLVFARTATREGEITVRTALGASRGRIIGQLFAEALVLSLLAAGVGLLLAAWGVRAGVDSAAQAMQQPLPFWSNDRLSLETVLYSVALAVVVAALIGVVPALKATTAPMQARLKQAGGGSTLQFGGIWTAVIVGQVALTMVFLMSVVSLGWNAYAGRSAPQALRVPAEHVYGARVSIDHESSQEGDRESDHHVRLRQALQTLERQLSAEPDVKAVTHASALPPEKHGEFFVELDGVTPTAVADPLWVRTAAVAPNYFQTFAATIVSGRGFSEADAEADRAVAVVDQTFVSTILGGRDPVGLYVRQPLNAENPSPGPWLEIIGVVQDVATRAEKTSEDAVLYRPLRVGTSDSQIAVRLSGDATTFGSRLRNRGARADPALRLSQGKTLDAVNVLDAVMYRFMLTGFGVVAAVALLLAVAGVYSLMAFTLSRRTREIGIRAALGAGPRRIISAVFSRAFLQVGLGLLAGSVPGIAIVALGGGEVTRGAGALLGIATALLISVIIVGVTAAACAGPTRRALRIQPTEALRADR
jgi:putative ABC transport system permease protein